MGTRSTVKFYNRKGRNILSLYNQYDGYLSGIGSSIVEFFNDEMSKGNGIEDIALLYVCYMKKGKPYHCYLTSETDQEEYNYQIFDTDEGIKITITCEKYSDEYGQFVLVTLCDYVSVDELEKIILKEGEE